MILLSTYTEGYYFASPNAGIHGGLHPQDSTAALAFGWPASPQSVWEACWKAFHLSSFVRMDIRVDENGQPWFLDINANPCLVFHPGGIVDSAQQSGLSLDVLLQRILKIPSS